MPDPELRDDSDPRAGAGPTGFGRLLGANLRVLLVAALVGLGAYWLWRGLALLFPEFEWLQTGR